MVETGDPVDQYLIHHLVTQAASIQTENGYHTDLGSKVVEEDIPPQNAPKPCLMLIEAIQQVDIEHSTSQGLDRVLTLTTKGVAAHHRANKAEALRYARLMRADIQAFMKKVATRNFQAPIGGGNFAELHLRIEEMASTIEIVSDVAVAQVDWGVTFITSRVDPHIGKPT